MSTQAQSSGLGNSMSDAVLYPRNLKRAFVVHEVVHGDAGEITSESA
jgi:hypothetical protein